MPANVQTMMYVGDKPWHGLGTKLDGPATAEEAIKAGGLDWGVNLLPLRALDKSLGLIDVEDHKAVVREDNKEVLGVVGSRVYRPLQNKEAFSFFDAVVGSKEAIYHTTGALGKGERIWILAKLPGIIAPVKGDEVEKYLLLANSHDGSLPVTMMFTPVRVVCQNTLNIALSDKAHRATVRHTVNVGAGVEAVRQELGIMNQQYALFAELSERLSHTPLNQGQWNQYRDKVLNVKDLEPGTERHTRTQNMMEKLSELFENGKGTEIAGVRGTAWAGFNAFTEFADYVRTTKAKGSEDAARMNRAESLLFGSGAALKQRAWDSAVSLIS